jgi:hypothetical protein
MRSAEQRFEKWFEKTAGSRRKGDYPPDAPRNAMAAFQRQHEIELRVRELLDEKGIDRIHQVRYMSFAKSADKWHRKWGDSYAFRVELDIVAYTWKRRGCDDALLNLIAKELFDVEPEVCKTGGEAA